jgi:hypothetical protein
MTLDQLNDLLANIKAWCAVNNLEYTHVLMLLTDLVEEVSKEEADEQ